MSLRIATAQKLTPASQTEKWHPRKDCVFRLYRIEKDANQNSFPYQPNLRHSKCSLTTTNFKTHGKNLGHWLILSGDISIADGTEFFRFRTLERYRKKRNFYHTLAGSYFWNGLPQYKWQWQSQGTAKRTSTCLSTRSTPTIALKHRVTVYECSLFDYSFWFYS